MKSARDAGALSAREYEYQRKRLNFYRECKRNFVGQRFWASGYLVSTVGQDEAVIREYIQRQEDEDKRLDQMNLWR